MAAKMFPDLELARTLYVNDQTEPAVLVRWLKREKPDVIIAPSTDVVPDIIGVVQRAGWLVPSDIGFVALACPQRDALASGIFQNGRMIGALALDMLISLLERNERGLPEQATTLMLEGQWNEGRTLRPPRAQAV